MWKVGVSVPCSPCLRVIFERKRRLRKKNLDLTIFNQEVMKEKRSYKKVIGGSSSYLI